MLAVHSQHIHAEVTGWRTPKGLLLAGACQGLLYLHARPCQVSSLAPSLL